MDEMMNSLWLGRDCEYLSNPIKFRYNWLFSYRGWITDLEGVCKDECRMTLGVL